MRILAISLLRLGDLILQRPLIEGLKKKDPQSEIHLLINRQFSQVEFLFSGLVDRFIYFDREVFQKSCGENEFNIFWGVQHLKDFVSEVNCNDYDSIYNLTHNRLTAHISGLVQARNRYGIYSKQGGFFGLTNPWIQFFNNYFGRPEAAGFHYTELLAKSLEIPLPAPSIRWRRPNGKNLILVQTLTSDPKKNWSLQKYAQLVEKLKTQCMVKVLGASFEKEILVKYFSEEDLLICGFEEAAKNLSEAALLITGDTSVKHLAALYEVPTVELSLGSSQPLQVGAYSNQSVILQTRVGCGPCPHSQPCSQTSHVCGDRLSVECVYEAAHMLMGLKRADWEVFAQTHQELNLFKTEIRSLLGWIVQCLSIGQKDKFEEVMQKKMMIVEELDRRHQAMNKGVSHEQRTRKLSDSGPQAS